jgi:hypothetical protein
MKDSILAAAASDSRTMEQHMQIQAGLPAATPLRVGSSGNQQAVSLHLSILLQLKPFMCTHWVKELLHARSAHVEEAKV